MKNVLKAFGFISLVAIIGFSFAALSLTGCGSGDSGEDTPPLSAFAGTWNASNGRSIYIRGDWFEYKVITDKTYDGTFSVSGSTITFNATGKGAASGKYTLSGDTLTLSNHTWDNTVDGAYTKVGDGGNTVVKTMTFEEFDAWWPEHEEAHRWGYSYKDASNPFDLASMYANNKAYLFTYSLTSDIDIDDFSSQFQKDYGDGNIQTSDWTNIVWDCKKNIRYSSSVFFVPNAEATGTSPTSNYLEFYNKNRNVNNPATVSFYQFNLEQVDIATLNSVTANGSATQTTTQLTLTFSKAITGLSANDITLSGVAGVTKGTLSGSGTTYTLPISGFTAGGTLNIAVEKSGYVFKNWLKTATIYYKEGSAGGGDVDGTFDSLDDFKNWLNGKGNNTKDNPYNVKLNLSDLSGLADFLKGLSGKFVNLDFSGSSFTGIGADAFKDLTNLTGITLPSGITSIGANAFNGCTNLTDITLPSGINSIGANAFNGCTNLNSVTFNGTITSGNFSSTNPFPGDLRDKYLSGGAGTYTRTSGGTTWTKQGGGGTPSISDFAGTWNASGNRSIVFSGSTFNYKVNGTTTYSGTFSVSGSTITFNATGLGTASGNFSLSGTTLTLSNHTWDSSVNGTYTKDSGGGGGGTADVYVAGEDYVSSTTVASLWKNGTQQILNSTSSSAQSVYVSGTDVYVAGYVVSGTSQRATLWKNGTAQTLSNNPSAASSVYVSGTDVYVAGYVGSGTGSSQRATLWKNGTAQTLSNTESSAWCVYVSGSDVYVAGDVGSRYSNSMKATLWKNGTAQTICANNSQAASVYVSGTDVYVVGYIGDYTPTNIANATLWKNGTAQTLNTASLSYAYSVYVSGSDVYVAGEELSIDSNNDYNFWKNGSGQNLGYGSGRSVYVSGTDVYVANGDYPRYWKNGTRVDLSATSTSNGHALSIFVVPKN